MTWQAGENYYQVVKVLDQVTNQIITIRPAVDAPAGYFRFRVLRR